jgi:branched-chain amino acid transport system permease protein
MASRSHEKHASRIAVCAGVVLLAVLIALPAFAGRALLQDLFFVFTTLALAQYWNLLAGYAGLVSIGQQAFVGLGAYGLFATTAIAGFDPLLAIVTGGALAAILAVPTAFALFRLRGAYFAIGTWVAAEVFRLLLAQVKELGGGTGMSLGPDITNSMAGLDIIKSAFDMRTPAARDAALYWLALLVLVATLAAVYLLLRSRHGLALAAIRDSETAAESIGVGSFHIKLFIYLLAGFGTGVIGALIYLQKGRISPDAAFSVLDWTAYVIFIVIIGGIGTIEGPIIGAIILYVLQDQLAGFGPWYLMTLGALAVIVMLVAPKGLWGLIAERFDIQLFPLRRQLRG